MQYQGDVVQLGDTRQLQGKLELLLRVAVAAEFIGHGAFGVIGKEGWLAYFEVLGIGESAAWHLMPMQGCIDITLGILLLVSPMRGPLAFMAAWGLFTAALRPLAGESIWELVERSYNYGIPLLLLLLYGMGSPSSWSRISYWFTPIKEVPSLSAERVHHFMWGLRTIISLYLIGHGSLGVFTNKELLLKEYDSLGLTSLVSDPSTLNTGVGLFEIALGVSVFAFPATALLLFVLVWKLATEALHFPVGAMAAGFEVIERASAYAAPLALILLKSMARERDGEISSAARLTTRHRSQLHMAGDGRERNRRSSMSRRKDEYS
jgi:uncharacterized membrane protein YphA (DoxX/SURF4 family)